MHFDIGKFQPVWLNFLQQILPSLDLLSYYYMNAQSQDVLVSTGWAKVI